MSSPDPGPTKSPGVRVKAVSFLLLGFAALAVALIDVRFRVPGIVAALIAMLLGATLASHARPMVDAVRPLVGRRVRAVVWGRLLPGIETSSLEVDSVTSFGAGLLIRLRTADAGSPPLLKVAQPRGARSLDRRVEIVEARYISWAGQRLPSSPDASVPALVLELQGA